MDISRLVPSRRSRPPSCPRTSGTEDTDCIDHFKSENDNLGPLGLNLLCQGSSPLIDLVFVHGLGGGSRKTWTKFHDPETYWPKEWLSRDVDFQRVRIHAFGYRSDWRTRDNILDIQDFARSLISSMHSNPHMRKNEVETSLLGSCQ